MSIYIYACESNTHTLVPLHYMFPSTQLLKATITGLKTNNCLTCSAFISKNSPHVFLTWRCVIVLAGSFPGMLQAVHQHTDSLLNLLMKVCDKMSSGT